MAGYLRFPNINNVTISGRLVRDVEVRYSQNNLPIVSNCIALSHYFKDEFGNQKEESSFVDIVAFGKTAQIFQDCLKKGSPVLIEGNLKTRTWQDQNGQNRKFTEIAVNRVYPLEREEGYTPNQNQNQNQGYQSQPSSQDNSYNNGYQNTQPRQNQNQNMNPDSFPYNDTSVNSFVTEDDVPF